MHHFRTTSESLAPVGIADWFALSGDDLEKIAVALLGARSEGLWVRGGGRHGLIANLKFGSLASRIPEELSVLAGEAKRILAIGGMQSALRAAAFFHLRLENIHPLGDGNGRVGRAILAAQVEQTLGVPVEETLRQLNAHENDYKMVFASGNQEFMFELMLDLIARLTGNTVSPESAKLPASILPRFPESRPARPMDGRSSGQKGQALNRPHSGGRAFRKFR